jgi:hypothetical protein
MTSLLPIYPHRHLVSAKVRAVLDLLAASILECHRWFNPDVSAAGEAPLETAGD